MCRKDWLKTFLELPKGIPSHDTFGRVFSKIKPEEFQKRFIEWVQAIEKLTAGQGIAVDGKELRRSHDQQAGHEAIYMVSAWATQNQLVLGQAKVADKPNEITAIPELLQLLDIAGCIVTIDALGMQTKIAETIVAGGGDYLLAVKENQSHLFEDTHACLKLMLHMALTRLNTAMPRLSIKVTDGLKFENAVLPKKKNISLWCASTRVGKD